MNHRVEAVVTGVKSIASACNPIPRKFKVSYFNAEHKWTSSEIMAYTGAEAASKVGKLVGIKLRAGYNCFVVRVIGR